METNKAYSAPAILEETVLEVEAGILAASHVDEPIEKDVHIEAMGQDLVEGIEWNHDWK